MTKKKHVQIGWAVTVLDGSRMFWPMDELSEAVTFCEDGTNPVAIWADAEDLKKHEEAQGETS